MEYITKYEKEIEGGFTTGVFATAAATASATMLLSGNVIKNGYAKLPNGEKMLFYIEDYNFDAQGVSCCVKKESICDALKDDNILAYAKVCLDAADGIHIKGCTGTGKISVRSLDYNSSKSSLNFIPRKLIIKNIQQVCNKYKYYGGVNVFILVPEIEEAMLPFPLT